MMLQEEIVFKEYFRCYCLDCQDVRIMQYDPRQPFHLRYVRNGPPVDPALLQKVHDDVLALNRWLGYDFNTVEMAVRDGIPYAIDFCNPAPDADVHSIGAGQLHLGGRGGRRAWRSARRQRHTEGGDNLRWGEYVRRAAAPPAAAVSTATASAEAAATATKAEASTAAAGTGGGKGPDA